MNPEDLQRLEKEVAKAKRIASEWASKVHDLVEDRLPAAFQELPELSRSTFEACQKWDELHARLVQIKKDPTI